MVKDLIPMIDATYRTIPDRDHRAMAGLSMGGMQTFQITLKHLDLFCALGGFSGGGGGFGAAFDPKTAHGGVMADADGFNKKVRLLWLGIGTTEPSGCTRASRTITRRWRRPGSSTSYYESPGTSHEWLTWRRCLHEFAPTGCSANQPGRAFSLALRMMQRSTVNHFMVSTCRSIPSGTLRCGSGLRAPSHRGRRGRSPRRGRCPTEVSRVPGTGWPGRLPCDGPEGRPR